MATPREVHGEAPATQAWVRQRIVGFDTETTGVDVTGDRIVTAALVVRDKLTGLSQVRTWIIDPGVEIPEAASAIHGITTEYARTPWTHPPCGAGRDRGPPGSGDVRRRARRRVQRVL